MATILDAFLVTFGLDSSGMEEGAEKGKSALEDLKSTAMKVLGVIGGAFAIKEMVGNFASGADAAMKLADALGEDMEQMQAMGRAAALEGGSVDAFNSSIKSLNASLVQVATTGEGRAKKFLDELGISATDASGKVKPASAILLELADSFQGLSAQEAAGLGEKLSLDAGTINLLRKGREEIERAIQQQKELGVYTKEDALVAADFNDQLDNMKVAFQMMVAPIVKLILPALTKFADMATKTAVKVREEFNKAFPDLEKKFKKFSDFMDQHGDAIGLALIAVAAIVLATYVPAMTSAALATLAATWPIIALGALIALLIDDFLAWQEGGDSVLGSMLGDFNEFFESVKPLFDKFTEFFKAYWNLLTVPVRAALALIKGIFTGDWNDLKKIVFGLGDSFQELVDRAMDLIFGPFFDWIGEKFSGIGEGIKEFFGMGGDDGASADKPRPGGVRSSEALPPHLLASKAGNQTTTSTVTTGNITITTAATDANGIAKDIGGALKDKASGALVLSADSGVRQ